MSVAVSSRPSTWSAVKNQVVYKLQRQDYALNQVNSAGGFYQLQINGVDATAYWQVGNSVYFETDSSSVTAYADVTASSFSAGNTLVTLNLAYGGAALIGGFANNLSKRTDYRVEVEVFKSSDNTSLTDGVVFSFTPANNAIAYGDISSIVKAYLSLDWTEPSTMNEVESDTFLKVYIKYQEYYDGALIGSQTSDSANPRYVVFAGLQIPSTNGNNLTNYVCDGPSKAFLTLFDSPKLWSGYPATISFIYPDALSPAPYLYRTQYDAAGVVIIEDSDALTTANDDAVNRLDLFSGTTLEANAKTVQLKIKPQDQGLNQVNSAAGFYQLQINGVDVTSFWQVGNQIYFETDSSTVRETGFITASAFSAGNTLITLNLGYGGVTLFGGFATNLTKHYTDELTFSVAELCDNPVLLFWKNSLGGDAFWLFDGGQESGYNFSGTKKAKRMTLFAEHLTLDQWEALNELNTLGEVYQENIVELTSAVNKTAVRDGAQVYVVDTDGNKTGVIVIPSTSVINTRDVTHSIEIEIEFPERVE